MLLAALTRAALAQDAAVSVVVVNNGWHTGIAVPAEAVPGLAAATGFGQAHWLEFGFGDEAFYRDPDPGLGTVLTALSADSPAVVHVLALDRPPHEAFRTAQLRPLSVQPGGAQALADFIAATFARGEAGALIDRGPGRYRSSRFFRAVGSFTLSHTCNTWAARALAAAGLSVRPTGVVTAEDLDRQLRALAATPAE